MISLSLGVLCSLIVWTLNQLGIRDPVMFVFRVLLLILLLVLLVNYFTGFIEISAGTHRLQ